MTIRQCLKRNGWQQECKLEKCRVMNVDICFINDEQRFDETQFSINAYDVDELDNLFTDFCKENGFKRNTVYNVVIVEMADSMEELS